MTPGRVKVTSLPRKGAAMNDLLDSVVPGKRFVSFVAGLFGLLTLSCSHPPSADVVTQLIRVERGNCVFQTMEVQEVGEFNSQGNYWPVKVRLKGACDKGTHTIQEDRIAEYEFYEEGLGYWRFREGD